VLTLSQLSLAGIPPLAGFAGKLMLFVATIDAGYTVLAIVAVLNTVVSLFYYLRVLAPMYFSKPEGTVEQLGGSVGTAVVLAALAVLGIGVGAGALLTRIGAGALLP
jgi:NADH-quinone oxidoreductase subunit N